MEAPIQPDAAAPATAAGAAQPVAVPPLPPAPVPSALMAGAGSQREDETMGRAAGQGGSGGALAVASDAVVGAMSTQHTDGQVGGVPAPPAATTASQAAAPGTIQASDAEAGVPAPSPATTVVRRPDVAAQVFSNGVAVVGAVNAAPAAASAEAAPASRKRPRQDEFVPRFDSQSAAQCFICKTDITSSPRILCVECKNVNMCPQCMGQGKEVGGHLRTHSYRVFDNLKLPLVPDRPDWTADEVLRMLDGLDMFGFGNWKEVGEHIGTKSAAAVEQYFVWRYLGGKQPFMQATGKPAAASLARPAKRTRVGKGPADAGGLETTAAPGAGAGAAAATALGVGAGAGAGGGSGAMGSGVEGVNGAGSGEEAGRGAGKGTPHTNKGKGKGKNNGAEEGATDGGPTASNEVQTPKTFDVAGYLPLRGDFDVEHDNQAELILADMEFDDEDDEHAVALKLKVLEIYNAKLDERDARKAFVIERGLLDFKRQTEAFRRRTREEREVFKELRPFARFHSSEEHEQLIKGIVLEQQLRKQIQKLQKYRRQGLRSLEEVEEFESREKQRQAENLRQKQRASASYLYETRAPGTSRERGARARRRGKPSTPVGSPKALPGRTPRASPEPMPTLPPVSLDGAPGLDLLKPKERGLCEVLHLLPSQYLAIKDSLIRHSVDNGFLVRDAVSGVARSTDPQLAGKVYDFCVQCGWVNSTSSGPTARITEKPATATVVSLSADMVQAPVPSVAAK